MPQKNNNSSNNIQQRICIAGKNLIAIQAIQYIQINYPDLPIVCLHNKNDTGIDNWQPSLKKFAESAKIQCVQESEVYDLEELIFISLEYDRIIPTKKFTSTNLFNIHFSLLPKYKGMYTSALPILFGDTESGVTLHQIDEGIDTGPIIAQRRFPITISDTAEDLYFKYLKEGLQLFTENFYSLINQTFKAQKQPAIGSTYYSKTSINYQDLKIDLKKTAFEVHNQFRAYTFRAFQLPTFMQHKIYKSLISSNKSTQKPGTIVSSNDTKICIATIDYDVELYIDH